MAYCIIEYFTEMVFEAYCEVSFTAYTCTCTYTYIYVCNIYTHVHVAHVMNNHFDCCMNDRVYTCMYSYTSPILNAACIYNVHVHIHVPGSSMSISY